MCKIGSQLVQFFRRACLVQAGSVLVVCVEFAVFTEDVDHGVRDCTRAFLGSFKRAFPASVTAYDASTFTADQPFFLIGNHSVDGIARMSNLDHVSPLFMVIRGTANGWPVDGSSQ